MLALSACLIGINCKYNGGNNARREYRELLQRDNLILLCPEIATMGCPREPAEIVGTGGGQGVWLGTAKVLTKSGKDVTEQFKAGALECLNILLKKPNIELVLLQPRSPSCGVGTIYDGTFSRRLINGDGVFTALLIQHGIPVQDIEKYCTGGKT